MEDAEEAAGADEAEEDVELRRLLQVLLDCVIVPVWAYAPTQADLGS